MQRGRPQRAWKPWRDTIIAIVVVIAIGSLASANPSLRAPRGPYESTVIVPTRAGGTTGATGHDTEPAEGGVSPSGGVDFAACVGLTALDNAICRHEALLEVHPDNQGLQNSLTDLLEAKAEHEAKADEEHGGHVPPEGGSSPSSANDHGQSGESHGNAGGDGQGNAGGESHGNAGGNGNGNAGGNGKGH